MGGFSLSFHFFDFFGAALVLTTPA